MNVRHRTSSFSTSLMKHNPSKFLHPRTSRVHKMFIAEHILPTEKADFHQGNLLDQKPCVLGGHSKSKRIQTRNQDASSMGIYTHRNIAYVLWLRKGTQNLKTPCSSLLVGNKACVFKGLPKSYSVYSPK